ncbi:hypothetical protein ACF0H5_009305 [Mactra antiquata]
MQTTHTSSSSAWLQLLDEDGKLTGSETKTLAESYVPLHVVERLIQGGSIYTSANDSDIIPIFTNIFTDVLSEGRDDCVLQTLTGPLEASKAELRMKLTQWLEKYDSLHGVKVWEIDVRGGI